MQATPSTGGTPGAYSCGNTGTQNGIPRGELGFKGFVTSDWGANHATSFINDGVSPWRWMRRLAACLHQG